jgi:hypothetical protein
MNRKKAIIIVIAILAFLVVLSVFLFRNTPSSQKIAVSNLSIDLGVQPENVNYGVTPPVANYTVENLNNVDVTSVVLSIDGVKSGQASLLIPPSRSVSTSTVLSNEALSASTTYEVEFVFTFADGTSETYSTSCTTPES